MKNTPLITIMIVSVALASGCSKQPQPEENAEVSVNILEENSGVTTNAVMAGVELQTPPVPMEMAAVEPLAVEDAGKPTPQLIQTALQNAGLYNGKIDGSIGPRTKRAIRAFQEQNSLKADGKVGPKTWQVLKAYLDVAPVAPDAGQGITN